MANPDLDTLFCSVIPFAKKALAKHSEFYPSGVWMSVEGQVGQVAGYSGDEPPTSQEIIDLLEDGLRQRADQGGRRETEADR